MFLFVVGLGRLGTAREAVDGAARAGARAGADALDIGLYRSSGVGQIKQDDAQTAVDQYMAASNRSATYNVSFVGNDTVVVDESFDQGLNILGVFGFGSITARGHGS